MTKALSSSDNLLPVVPDVTRVDQVKVAALLPIIAVVFIAYLVIGLALPVLPLHVHEGLGLGTFGVTLTGLGYSLVYPGFGVEAFRHAPPQSRGLAMGAYTAFLDPSLGLASPALGLVASGPSWARCSSSARWS